MLGSSFSSDEQRDFPSISSFIERESLLAMVSVLNSDLGSRLACFPDGVCVQDVFGIGIDSVVFGGGDAWDGSRR